MIKSKSMSSLLILRQPTYTRHLSGAKVNSGKYPASSDICCRPSRQQLAEKLGAYMSWPCLVCKSTVTAYFVNVHELYIKCQAGNLYTCFMT